MSSPVLGCSHAVNPRLCHGLTSESKLLRSNQTVSSSELVKRKRENIFRLIQKPALLFGFNTGCSPFLIELMLWQLC